MNEHNREKNEERIERNQVKTTLEANTSYFKRQHLSVSSFVVTILSILTAMGMGYAYLSSKQAEASNIETGNATAISALQADDENTKANYAAILNGEAALQTQITALNQSVISLSQKIQ